jgi:hypothetical protein
MLIDCRVKRYLQNEYRTMYAPGLTISADLAIGLLWRVLQLVSERVASELLVLGFSFFVSEPLFREYPLLNAD